MAECTFIYSAPFGVIIDICFYWSQAYVVEYIDLQADRLLLGFYTMNDAVVLVSIQNIMYS